MKIIKKIQISILSLLIIPLFILLNINISQATTIGASAVQYLDRNTSFTLSSNGSTAEVTTNGAATVGISVQGTFTATLVPELNANGSTYLTTALPIQPVGGGSTVTSITAPGAWTAQVAGYQKFHLRVSSYTSGSATIVLNVSSTSNAFTCIFGCLPGQYVATVTSGNSLITIGGTSLNPTISGSTTPSFLSITDTGLAIGTCSSVGTSNTLVGTGFSCGTTTSGTFTIPSVSGTVAVNTTNPITLLKYTPITITDGTNSIVGYVNATVSNASSFVFNESSISQGSAGNTMGTTAEVIVAGGGGSGGTTYTAGTGININGSNVISNTGLLSAIGTSPITATTTSGATTITCTTCVNTANSSTTNLTASTSGNTLNLGFLNAPIFTGTVTGNNFSATTTGAAGNFFWTAAADSINSNQCGIAEVSSGSGTVQGITASAFSLDRYSGTGCSNVFITAEDTGGNIGYLGAVHATSFYGSGANLTTGTIPNAALVTTPLTGLTGGNQINITGSAPNQTVALNSAPTVSNLTNTGLSIGSCPSIGASNLEVSTGTSCGAITSASFTTTNPSPTGAISVTVNTTKPVTFSQFTPVTITDGTNAVSGYVTAAVTGATAFSFSETTISKPNGTTTGGATMASGAFITLGDMYTDRSTFTTTTLNNLNGNPSCLTYNTSNVIVASQNACGFGTITSGSFVIPSINSTVNITITDNIPTFKKYMPVTITDGTNVISGYLSSQTTGTAFTLMVQSLTQGAVGNTMASNAAIVSGSVYNSIFSSPLTIGTSASSTGIINIPSATSYSAVGTTTSSNYASLGSTAGTQVAPSLFGFWNTTSPTSSSDKLNIDNGGNLGTVGSINTTQFLVAGSGIFAANLNSGQCLGYNAGGFGITSMGLGCLGAITQTSAVTIPSVGSTAVFTINSSAGNGIPVNNIPVIVSDGTTTMSGTITSGGGSGSLTIKNNGLIAGSGTSFAVGSSIIPSSGGIVTSLNTTGGTGNISIGGTALVPSIIDSQSPSYTGPVTSSGSPGFKATSSSGGGFQAGTAGTLTQNAFYFANGISTDNTILDDTSSTTSGITSNTLRVAEGVNSLLAFDNSGNLGIKGNLGVGTTTLTGRPINIGSSGTGTYSLQIGNSSTYTLISTMNADTVNGIGSSLFGLYLGGTGIRVAIDTSGNISTLGAITASGSITSVSQRQFKNNIKNLSDDLALNAIRTTKIVQYCYKTNNCKNDEEQNLGFIADDTSTLIAPKHKVMDIGATASLALKGVQINDQRITKLEKNINYNNAQNTNDYIYQELNNSKNLYYQLNVIKGILVFFGLLLTGCFVLIHKLFQKLKKI